MNTSCLFGPNDVPVSKPEDVIPFLGKASHWREGRSAYEVAHSWCRSPNALPPAIAGVLASDDALAGARLVRAVFEKQTSLDDFGRPSQTDVLAHVMTKAGPAVIAVEGKVDEPFGPTVAEWLSEDTPGKRGRLAGLLSLLGITGDVASLRYQLLHRSAAALIEAKAASAREALLVVQSFSPADRRAGFADFAAFTELMGAPVSEPGGLSSPVERAGTRLRFGWAQDRVRGG